MKNWSKNRKKITVLCTIVLVAGVAAFSAMIPHHPSIQTSEQNRDKDASVAVADIDSSAETKGIGRILQMFETDARVGDKTESDDAVEEKRDEFAEAEGLCTENSIVLSDTSEETVTVLAEKLGAEYRITPQGDYAVLYLPEGTKVADVMENPDMEPFLSQMTPDYYAQISALDARGNPLNETRPNYTVNDELYAQQTYLDYLNLSDTWSVTRGSGVTVAVIDSGIDTDNPEFTGRISDMSYNASEDKIVRDYGMDMIEDEQGHGTLVAGVLGAGMDGNGITGIAPEVSLLVIKCDCDESGRFARSSDLVFGLAYAIEQNADVINMSFDVPDNVFGKYTRLASDSDCICIAAAGNDGSSMPVYPAADPYVIGVGSLNHESWSLASFSNYGDNVELLTPGMTITTTNKGGYEYCSGTSVSSPIVAGAVALYLSMNPDTETAAVEEMLQASSTDLGPLGEDWENGFGLLDIHALVCGEKGTVTYEMLTDEVENLTQTFVKGKTLQRVPEPERENVVLDGWFYDTEVQDEFDCYNTVFTQDVTLYAGWINEDEGTAYLYTSLDDGTVEITGYTGKRRYLTIPSEIGGKTVSSIGESAFADKTRIRSVILPESLRSIGNRAFVNDSNLRSIDIPEAVTQIGFSAFSGCSALSMAYIRQNSKLQSIGREAFAMSGVGSFTIPSRLTELGEDVFLASTRMRSVTVATGNSTFCTLNGALYNAAGDTLLYYPAMLSGTYTVGDGTATIGQHAFAYSRSEEIILPDSVRNVKKGAFQSASIRKLIIPSGVQTLEDEICQWCTNLSDLTLENGSYNLIQERSFENCSSLKTLTIPKSITDISREAFAYSGLTEVLFEDSSQLSFIREKAFYSTPLRRISFPSALQGIEGAAFSYCLALEEISFDDNSQCQTIGDYAFSNSFSLQSVQFPDSLKALGQCSFYFSGLKSVNLGSGIEQLGAGPFARCEELSEVTVAENNPVYCSEDGVVFDKEMTALVMFPAGKTGTYVIPSGITSVGAYAFCGASRLTSVVFNDGLTTIGECAFSNCIALTELFMPESLKMIGGSAFAGCTGLTMISLSESLESIGEEAFAFCISLSNPVVIPANVISLGRAAFDNDFNLHSITIEPDSRLSRIGYGVFANCGIEDFTVPENVATMGQEVFSGCSSLITVTFEGDSRLTQIAAWTFDGADQLRQISFEEGSCLNMIEARAFEGLTQLERINLEVCTELETINNYAFINCPSLQQVLLPDSVTEIGRYAFANCTALSELQLPPGIRSIGRYAFANCISLSELYLPTGIQFIGSYAFAGTSGLNVFFQTSVLPSGLQDHWDDDIGAYYLDVSSVQTSGDWTYSLTNDGKAGLIGYSGTDRDIVLSSIDGHEIVSVGSGLFEDNSVLQNITLPDTLTGIYAAAFKGTSTLDHITIPANVRIIDKEAFRGSGVREVSFASGSRLCVLGQYSFAETANLSSVSLPEAVEKLRDYAFYRSGLQSISFGQDSQLCEIGRSAFSESAVISLTLPDSLKKIDYDAFRGTSALSAVDFGAPDDLMIYGEAFYQSGLQSVTIPAGVSYLGEFCFSHCSDLNGIQVEEANTAYSSANGVLFNKDKTRLITCPAGKTGSYTIPTDTASLAFAAFEGSRLENIVIPATSQLKTIGYRAFSDCDNLSSMSIPDSVLSIGNYAFAYCDSLSSVNVSSDGQMNLIGKGAFYNDAALTGFVIPDAVQEIEEYAFYGCSAMDTIQLGRNGHLQLIGAHAFEYSGIRELHMPELLDEIGDYAFRGSQMELLEMNNRLTYLGDGAFGECSLSQTTVLTIPDTISYIGTGALNGAVSLKEITLPFLGNTIEEEIDRDKLIWILSEESKSSLEKVAVHSGSLGSEAFMNYSALDDVAVPETVTVIPPWAFCGCGSIKSISLPDSVLTIGDCAFLWSKLESIDLPEGLTFIGTSAFEGTNLQELILPESVEETGNVFIKDTKIAELHIPAKLCSYYTDAFYCTSLERVTLDSRNPYFTLVNGWLYTADMKRLLFVPKTVEGEIVIPDGVEYIASNAFYEHNGITKVTIPSSTFSLGDHCFGNCNHLESVIIHSNSYANMQYAFADCSNLHEVEISEGISTIGGGMFSGCRSLQEIRIPDSVESIQSKAFYGCDSLNTVYFGRGLKEIGSSAFEGCTALTDLNISSENNNFVFHDGILYNSDYSGIAYIPASFSGRLVIPDGMKNIPDYAFFEKRNITSVIIPDSVESIGDAAFLDCSELEEVELGDGLQRIGNAAFNDTKILNDAIADGAYEDGVFYIGRAAISIDPAIEDVIIKDDTTVIAGGAASSGYHSVKHLYLPDSVTNIGKNAFKNCSELISVRMSENVDSIEEEAFVECSQLKSIVIPENCLVAQTAFSNDSLEYAIIGNVGSFFENGSWMKSENWKCLLLSGGSSAVSMFGTKLNNVVLTDPDGFNDSAFASIHDTNIFINRGEELGSIAHWWNLNENHNTVYYQGEWNLATFYINGSIVMMDPVRKGGVLQAPAGSIIHEYLWAGQSLRGWDINGDGQADTLPATLNGDLEAVAVLDTPVCGISMQESAELGIGDTLSLNAAVQPIYHNGTETLIWSSSDESVATVNSDGVVTSVAEGTATITVSLADDPSVSASCSVTVVLRQPGIYLAEDNGVLNKGGTMVLQPRIIRPEGDNSEVVYTSSDPDVAVVDSDGTITALCGGNTTITITCGEYSAVYTLSVRVPMEGIMFREPLSSLNVGETQKLQLSFLPADTTDSKSAEYISADSAVATVSRAGMVTAVAPGTTTITVTVDGFSDSFDLTVYAPIQWIRLNTTTGTMRLDRTKQLEVIYEPSNTTDDRTVSWSSDDETIASVSDTGMVTARKRGITTITGTVGDHTATYTVTVIGLRDQATGITVTNADDTPMADTTELVVGNVDESEAIRIDLEEYLGRTLDTAIYDISLTDGDRLIQPETDVDVEIPVPADVDGGSATVYRVEEDGSYTDMNAIYENGLLCFTTDHFSTYVVASDQEPNVLIANDITGGSVSAKPGKAAEGETVTLTVIPNDGYELDELTVKDADNNEVVVENNRFIMPTGIVTVNATFKLKTHTVTIEKDGNCDVTVYADYTEAGGGTLVSSGDNVPVGTVLTVFVVAHTGYQLTTVPEKYYTVTEDLTITALTEKLTCRLTLNHVNGAEPMVTGADDLDAVPYGTRVTVIAGEADAGYEFKGWYNADGELLTGSAEYTVSVENTMTLEARYQKMLNVVTFILTKNGPEAITGNTDLTVCEGEQAAVTVIAEGDGLSYQWYYKDTGSSRFKKSSLTGSEYTVEMTDARDGRQIYCVIKDAYGETVQSDTVTLRKIVPLIITMQPQSVTVGNGETARVSVEAEGKNLSYQWYYKDTGSSKFRKSSLTGSEYTVEMTDARNGRQLYCVITDEFGETVQTDTVVISQRNELKITKQPENVEAAVGQLIEVPIEAEGDGLSYQWYVKNATASKFSKSSITNSVYVVKMSENVDGRQIYCVITDAYGETVQTITVTLSQKQELRIITQPENALVFNGEKAISTVEAEGKDLTYQWYIKNATASKFSKSSVQKNTYSVTMSDSVNGRQIYCVITDAYGETVQTDAVILRQKKELRILTQPQNVEALSGNLVEIPVEAEGDGLSYQWYVKNATASKFSKSSVTNNTYRVTMSDSVDGRQIYCVITDAYGETVKTETVTLKKNVPLTITLQPQSVAVGNGETARVSVEVEGKGLSYQWYFKDAGSSKFKKSSITASKYTVEMTDARNGRQLYCVITDAYGETVQTDTVIISQKKELKIVKQPEDVQAAVGQLIEVPIEAEGDGLSYQWYVKNATASKFSKSSVTNSVYRVKMSDSVDGRQIYCVITDAYGETVKTETVTLKKNVPLAITLQPQSVTVAKGDTARLSVEAEGDGLTYQWYFKDAGSSKFKKSSITASEYTVEMTDARNGRQLYCVITDAYGEIVQTDTVVISQKKELKIVKQPENVEATMGHLIEVPIEVEGEGLSYQWYIKNATASRFSASSITNNTYRVTMSDKVNGRQIYCVISDESGNVVTTEIATLYLNSN